MRNEAEAQALLAKWMAFERHQYYQIVVAVNEEIIRIASYDPHDQEGVFNDRSTVEFSEFARIQKQVYAWQPRLKDISAIFEKTDNEMTLPLKNVDVISEQRDS
jgi:hypothetical protein